MAEFKGFPGRADREVALPDPFFTELLGQIDHLGELKVTLYFFWRIRQVETSFPCLWASQFHEDPGLLAALDDDLPAARSLLEDALERACARNTLVRVEITLPEGKEFLFMLNSPRGRAGLQAIETGTWQPDKSTVQEADLSLSRPNIYRLYEEHIGPLSPMISEALQEAESRFPAGWIEDAVRIAVENNVRRWRYVEAILRTWQEEGRDDRQSRRDLKADRQRYVRGKFSEFIEH